MSAPPFRKVLIANRGEIAVRIARTLREMNICVAAVHSEPDADAPHVAAADEAHNLGGQTSQESYLRGDRIIEIAREIGAEAIHPGYGFLSENASFAEACNEAGIVFIGPTAPVIRTMGDKITAKRTMDAAGVPTVPGWSSDTGATLEDAQREAGRIGFPLLIKASAGGGGKGMRVVHEAGGLAEAFGAAQREARAAFGDDRVFLERYIPVARHIEIQIIGDRAGNVVHLLERECSVQRRHQKLIEESPSPALDEDLRRRMGEAAVRGAQAIGYENAGTFEFMVEPDGRFHFLEVNARLQVEHPVTELVTGFDLVRLQMEVAAGHPLPIRQEDVSPRGHAIECRICAEDAARGFLPSTGTLRALEWPSGPGVRVDSGVREGSEVTVHYDPMIAKLIVHAPSRDAAIERMRRALHETCVLGVTTNAEFLGRVLDHPLFRAGNVTTRFLEEHPLEAAAHPPDAAALIAAALASRLSAEGSRTTTNDTAFAGPAAKTPWTSGAWRLS